MESRSLLIATRNDIHGHIKPSDILVADRDGRPSPKVIDFGLANALEPPLDGATELTNVGMVVGTLDYMSPDQADLDTTRYRSTE